MKFITFICLSLMFVGCAGKNKPAEPNGDNPAGGNPVVQPGPPVLTGQQPVPNNQPSQPQLEPGVASQTVLTCSKEGADDVVYTAKTYQVPRDCLKDKNEQKKRKCKCEVFSANASNPQGVYLFATGTEEDWCESDALDQIMNNTYVSVNYWDKELKKEIEKEIKLLHDPETFTCSM